MASTLSNDSVALGHNVMWHLSVFLCPVAGRMDFLTLEMLYQVFVEKIETSIGDILPTKVHDKSMLVDKNFQA